MAAASSISSMGEDYILPSTNSAKPYQYLVDVIGLDHNYCRPWSECEKVPHARPAKELFSPQTERLDNEPDEKQTKSSKEKLSEKDELIDVDTLEEDVADGPGAINMQYDVAKSKVVMSECEKYASSASSKRTPDTWEELICRTGWTTQQNVLFDKVLKIVSCYRLAWLTYQGSANESVLRRVAVDKATKRVRQIFSRIEWDTKLTTWLHSSMVDGLSIPLLACYLDIVQTLRSKVPTLVDKMLAGGTTHRRVSPANSDNLTALMKRPWDATVGLTSFQRPRKITGTPLLLIVPSGPTTSATGNSTKRSRFWHHHLSLFGKVIPVTMHLSNSGRGVSIGQCLDHMIGAVQAKVLELKNHFPNRPVVLIGWATGALVSFQVSLKESVCAVVCLGFPLLGVEGLRGGAGDQFLDSKTPTMFVFGSLSTSCSHSDMEEFRNKLLADTSLLVIPGADDQLRLTSAKKKMERVTQSVVDRRVMDDIGEFLNQAVNSMNDDSHPRLNYFDFDDVENARKKPKTVYRKRLAGDGTGSAPVAKKPRGRTPKVANGEGSVPKKPKPVKNVKKVPASKPVVLVPGTTGQASGSQTSRPAGNIPIAPLRTAHSTISSGILQGVPLTSVPISAVPLSGVPVSRVGIPGIRIPGVSVSGVDVPVSAVIKQGSLGGRSFVFPGSVGSTATGVSTTTMGTLGNAQHLKIVVNPTTDTGVKSSGPPKSVGEILQYKTAIVTIPNKPSAPVRATNPTALTSQASNVVSTASSPLTSALLTPASVKPQSTTKATSLVITSATSSVHQVTSSAGSKPIVVSRSVVTVPKSAIVSGQAQFIMHQGQVSAVGKQATMRPSSPGNTTTQQKPVAQSARVNTPTSTKPQTILSNIPAKQSTVRVSPAGSAQAATDLARKTPSPQAMSRTIQVGVKRTVTYNPSTPSKTVTVVSRSLPSEALTTHTSNLSSINIARLKAKIKNMHNLSGVPTSGQMQQLKTTLATTLGVQNKSRNVAQSTEGQVMQTTSKIQPCTQSAAPSKNHASSQSTAPSSAPVHVTQKSSTSVEQTAVKPSVQTAVTSPTKSLPTSHAPIVTSSTGHTPARSNLQAVSTTTAKSSAQTVQASAQSMSLSAQSKTTVQAVGKLNLQTSTTTQSRQATGQPSVQAVGKSGTQTTGKSIAQSTTKMSTHFIQVPASARAAMNTSKTSAQLSAQNIPSTTQVSTQSSVLSRPRVTGVTIAASVCQSQANTQSSHPTTTTVASSQSAVSIAGKGPNVDESDSTSLGLSAADEDRLVEKINSIVSGKQRTTRQSVRRLVAAAKLAETQTRRGDSGEGSKD